MRRSTLLLCNAARQEPVARVPSSVPPLPTATDSRPWHERGHPPTRPPIPRTWMAAPTSHSRTSMPLSLTPVLVASLTACCKEAGGRGQSGRVVGMQVGRDGQGRQAQTVTCQPSSQRQLLGQHDLHAFQMLFTQRCAPAGPSASPRWPACSPRPTVHPPAGPPAAAGRSAG